MFRNAKRFQKLRKSAESAVNMSNFRNSSRSGRKINELMSVNQMNDICAKVATINLVSLLNSDPNVMANSLCLIGQTCLTDDDDGT